MSSDCDGSLLDSSFFSSFGFRLDESAAEEGAADFSFLSVFESLDGLPPSPDALAARCCSCSSRRSALLSLGFLGGMTRLAGLLFSFLGPSVAAAVGGADGSMVDGEGWR